MDVLIRAVENHFKYEEWRFGDNSTKMNQKHINEHRRILRKYFEIVNRAHDSNAQDIKNEIVGMLKIVLMSHVKNFDCVFFQGAS